MLAANLPPLQVYNTPPDIGQFDVSNPSSSLQKFRTVQAGDLTWANDFNYNAALAETVSVGGGGCVAVLTGLNISAGTGLALNVSPGMAFAGTPVQLSGLSTLPLTANGSFYVWLSVGGTLYALSTPTNPSTPSVYLGYATTNASSVTSIDTDGVVRIANGVAYRFVGDEGIPKDSPTYGWFGLTINKAGNVFYTSRGQYTPIGRYGNFSSYPANTPLRVYDGVDVMRGAVSFSGILEVGQNGTVRFEV